MSGNHLVFKLKMRKMNWLKPALSTHREYDLEVDLERWIIKFGSPYELSSNHATVLPSDFFLIASLGRAAKKCTQRAFQRPRKLILLV